MSCIFCDSRTHVPQNCNVYASDNSRRQILRTKNRCEHCLFVFDGNNHSTDSCFPQRKCYICFSRSHHTVYCPDRFTAFSKPNIDKELLFRFSQMLNHVEKYALVSPDFTAKAQSLKPIKIVTTLTINDDYLKETPFDSMILVTDQLKLCNICQYDSFILYTTKNVIANAKIVNMENLRTDPHHFFSFISSKTRKLCCPNVEFTSAIMFAEILCKLSDIEEMNFMGSNLDFCITWPQELLHSNVAKLKKLTFTLKDINLCAKTLAEFMIKNNNILIILYCDNVNRAVLQTHLSKYFVAPRGINRKGSMLKITLTAWPQFPHYLQFYVPITNLVNKY